MEVKVVLEEAARMVVKDTSKSKPIYTLRVAEGREIFENLQSSPIYKYPANVIIDYINVSSKKIKVYIVIPKKCVNFEKVIFYIHGAGWVFGSFHTHEKLVRELAYRTNSLLIFPEYTRSPEAKFPTAIEECYTILTNIPNILKKNNLKVYLPELIVAGDSVGGNMAIAMTLIAKYQNGPKISKLLLFYPVTNDDFNTNSYSEFAVDYYLDREGMIWFWDNYAPNKDDRENILAAPLKASLEQLTDFPETMIINGEADVLRDEGEAFANKLRLAGNKVTAIRLQGIIHDFVMLNSLDKTKATRMAMLSAISWINCK